MVIICANKSGKHHHYLKWRIKRTFAEIEKDEKEKDELIKELKTGQTSFHDEIFEL